MTFEASAVGTFIVPPLMGVPAAAVVIVDTWQTAQPICSNRCWPARTSLVIGPRGGAFVERMKLAKARTSLPSSSGSCTGSYADPHPTKRPLDVFSVGISGLVMPISLRYASAENDVRLAC